MTDRMTTAVMGTISQNQVPVLRAYSIESTSFCDCKPGTFDFLGFTHYWGKSRRGKWTIKRKTASKRFTPGLKRINEWCRRNRHQPLAEQHRILCQKLRGHCAYYGITGNGLWLKKFREEVKRRWQKWLNRRSRRAAMPWERFQRLLQRYRLPPPRVVHSIYVAKP